MIVTAGNRRFEVDGRTQELVLRLVSMQVKVNTIGTGRVEIHFAKGGGVTMVLTEVVKGDTHASE